MDSLATLDYPAMGYGLRYQYGLFRQIILDGFQHEQPDYWLNFGNPWEIERVHVSYTVKFYGTVEEQILNGEKCKIWVPGETVEAVAYDNPIPGYGTRNTINLRLWAAKPSNQYDLESFNTGENPC
ncbi:Glycogen phosphorylase 1 [Camellia lanceoleosa]|uniref:Glycogen phosphorylase 1 n=1 Tax=Camellia lanceoleosa TaxID=1840588 RepID=A0ACC0J4M2_9ERIC|nr:Glycogen phosphorylase 1 [Camellia lanceoleosa]